MRRISFGKTRAIFTSAETGIDVPSSYDRKVLIAMPVSRLRTLRVMPCLRLSRSNMRICACSTAIVISHSVAMISFFSRNIQTARSEEHTSELQSLMRTSYAVLCSKQTTSKPDTHRLHNGAPSTYHNQHLSHDTFISNTPESVKVQHPTPP